jgi:PTH1 family peptidyl-tRNA hydrolase
LSFSIFQFRAGLEALEIPVARIVTGLGNPGERYAMTRQNAGFMVVDALARENKTTKWTLECDSLTISCEIGGNQVLLAKPMTYMNLSGRAVAALLDRYGLGRDKLIVVLDDLNLPYGRIRIRERGSGGGHHGLESVISELGSDEFARIRIGIGEDSLPEDKAEFVLSDFPRGRELELGEIISRAGDAVKTILSEGVSKAMSAFNGQR